MRFWRRTVSTTPMVSVAFAAAIMKILPMHRSQMRGRLYIFEVSLPSARCPIGSASYRRRSIRARPSAVLATTGAIHEARRRRLDQPDPGARNLFHRARPRTREWKEREGARQSRRRRAAFEGLRRARLRCLQQPEVGPAVGEPFGRHRRYLARRTPDQG